MRHHTKPVTYRDWHRLYHELLTSLGTAAETYFRFRYMRMTDFAIHLDCHRRIWIYTHRLKRIEDHMDERRDAGCPTWHEHLMGSIFGRNDEP